MAYEAVNIQVLKGLEAVRKRPAMYIGDTGTKGLHHLVWEILDNSVDEAMAGYCTEISVTIEEDGETIVVKDNGRGIPVTEHPTEKKSALEIVMTVLHAGGKFDGSGYEAAGGLHGVGASCVNALSDKLTVEVVRDGGMWTQSYKKGIPNSDVKRVKDAKGNGTTVTFHPDIEIFKQGIKFNQDTLVKRFREVSFLNRGLKINFENKATKFSETLQYDGGIADYVSYLTNARNNCYPSSPLFAEEKTKLETRDGNVLVQVAVNWSEEDDETTISFANNINTIDGGTHLSGFKTALTRVVNQFARSTGILKDSRPNLGGEDIREGMTAIISVRLPQPEFVGQTKAKLGTVEMESIVSVVVTKMLTDYFDKNAAVVKRIIERAVIAQEARDAAKKQAAMIKRKSLFGGTRLPGKLTDCNSKKRDNCELFIVEGDSAAGSAKSGRDVETQAILPIRGKIINSEKSDLLKLFKNTEIESLIMAIGAGVHDDFKIDDRRYDKIIVMADADDDGCHIATLLMTFFYRYMKDLVTGGHVYLARPPLYRVDNGKNEFSDREKTKLNPDYVCFYCFDDNELQESISKIGSKYRVVRFKGLGEMNASELAKTTMDINNRRMIQLNVSDFGETERIMSILMGSNAQSRKEHITSQINNLVAV